MERVTLKVQTSEKVTTQEKIFGFKPWLGKLKGFFTVKILPARRD